MATLHLLGTGAVVSDPSRTTTMFAVHSDGGLVLVDCGGDAVQRLLAHDLDPLALDALIVTHEHADHVGGFPLLMERLWVMGRKRPLDVYGIPPAVAQARRSHDAFDTSGWEGYGGFRTVEFPERAETPVFEAHGLRVSASPGRHAVPVVALRIEDLQGGGVVAYSCDTAPEAKVVALSRDCDLMLHEATGEGAIHSSAAQAAEVARDAGAGKLILVHLPPAAQLEADLPAARAIRPELAVGEDGQRYTF